MSKPRVVKSYENLDEELQEQIKLAYPSGFAQHLITYDNAAGAPTSALIFETDEKIYLIKMTRAQAFQISADDEDFNSDGVLKEGAREEYEDKYSDLDYMSDYIDDDGDDIDSDSDSVDEDPFDDY